MGRSARRVPLFNFNQPQNVHPVTVKHMLKLEKATILGSLDTIIQERTHIPKTNSCSDTIAERCKSVFIRGTDNVSRLNIVHLSGAHKKMPGSGEFLYSIRSYQACFCPDSFKRHYRSRMSLEYWKFGQYNLGLFDRLFGGKSSFLCSGNRWILGAWNFKDWFFLGIYWRSDRCWRV